MLGDALSHHEDILNAMDSELLEEWERLHFSQRRASLREYKHRIHAEQARQAKELTEKLIMMSEAQSFYPELFDEYMLHGTSLLERLHWCLAETCDIQRRRHELEGMEGEDRAIVCSEEETSWNDIGTRHLADQTQRLKELAHRQSVIGKARARKTMELCQRQEVMTEALSDFQEVFDIYLGRLASLREQQRRALAV